MSDTFIPLSSPNIKGNEWEYVKSCLDSEWVSSAGPFVDRFEKEFASYTGSRHAIACSSGTAALHVSLLLAGVKEGDEVLVPSLTFIATVNAIKYCGANPVFFDCDEFYNIDVPSVTSFLEEGCRPEKDGLVNLSTGRRVAAVLPVHVFGNAVDLPNLLEICSRLRVPVIEDAAESLGTAYSPARGGRHTGTLGLMGAFSFNGNKIITTGGGGMIVTDDDALARKAKYLTTQAKDDEVRFVHDEIGYNYRMTNIQAAIGVAQLERLPEYLAKKRRIFDFYQRELAGVDGLSIGPTPPYSVNNKWMIALQVDSKAYGETREELMARLQRSGIQTRPVWLPNHRQKPFLSAGRHGIKRTEHLWEITLNIPSSIGISDEQLARVVKGLKRG